MRSTIASFFSLYLAAFLLLLSTGLFNTYLGLRLTADHVSEVWVGALIAIYYVGLVVGARFGHRLITRVGHIRAYSASAAVVTALVLVLSLLDNLWVWLLLRFVAGLAMVTQFMAIESWLNEQTESRLRGRVFAFYMVFSGLGTVFGQLALTLFPELDTGPLVFSAICSVLGLVPVALTRRLHPEVVVPAPIMARYYLSRVPMSLLTVFVTGNLTGAFYGLAPVFAARQGLSSEQVAVFLAAAVAAGLLAQWPLGMLSDKVNRAGLIRMCALLLALCGLPLWGGWTPAFWVMLAVSATFGALQFPLYPIGAAFANDNVDPDRRVGLAAIVLMVYGSGAGLGPFVAGALMHALGPGVLFVFFSACAAVLVAFVRPQRVTGVFRSEDAPTHFVPMTEVQATVAAASLDPRVDPESDISASPVVSQPASTA